MIFILSSLDFYFFFITEGVPTLWVGRTRGNRGKFPVAALYRTHAFGRRENRSPELPTELPLGLSGLDLFLLCYNMSLFGYQNFSTWVRLLPLNN